MAYANRIFKQIQNSTIILFNAMIKGYSLNGPFEESFCLYTLAPLLKACSSLGVLQLGKCIHKEVLVVGFEGFSSIRIGVIELYSSCGVPEDAEKVFDEMYQRDVIVWNLMIRGFCKRGDVDMELCLFRQMRKRSVVSWNIMISCLAQSRRDSEALGLFHDMMDWGFKPDEATVVTVLPICARLGSVDVGKWIHSYAKSSGLYRDFVAVGNALVDFYNKSGMFETARRIFDEMPRKNVISWNTLISGLAFNGNGELGVELLEEMMNEGVSPNDATFVGVLSCCAHAGLFERGRELLASMVEHHQIEPKLEHYGCMVDLLGRSGCVREAYDLIRSMPGETPNATLWGSLLSACRTHGDIELAHLAVKELIDLEPWNSGNYVLLSNMYAEEERWDKVANVRGMMREKNVKKTPGQSVTG